MYRAHPTGGIFGKVAHLALVGAGMLFVGPIAIGLGAAALGVVVAILALLLPFVVIGAIGYAPFLLVRHLFGKPKQQPTAEVRRVLPEIRPIRPAAVEIPVERPAPPRPERRIRSTVARVTAEVFCGALVGGVLGAVALIGASNDWRTGALLDYSVLGAGVGAVVGFVVGGPRQTPADKPATIA
jgi:hypothetical protein